MFTGIIEEVGTVTSVQDAGNGREFRVRAAGIAAEAALGDSIAIDGACQTVTRIAGDEFAFVSVATTLQRTTFGGYRPGRRVNLERSLPLGGRLGGHLVQGHVDGTGTVRTVERRAELVLIDFEVPADVAAVTILHGSIALNGISLTINALPAAAVVQVSIIPYTWEHTALSDVRVGDPVNVEGDLIGKYVRNLLGAPVRAREDAEAPSAATEDLLRAWGY